MVIGASADLLNLAKLIVGGDPHLEPYASAKRRNRLVQIFSIDDAVIKQAKRSDESPRRSCDLRPQILTEHSDSLTCDAFT